MVFLGGVDCWVGIVGCLPTTVSCEATCCEVPQIYIHWILSWWCDDDLLPRDPSIYWPHLIQWHFHVVHQGLIFSTRSEFKSNIAKSLTAAESTTARIETTRVRVVPFIVCGVTGLNLHYLSPRVLWCVSYSSATSSSSSVGSSSSGRPARPLHHMTELESWFSWGGRNRVCVWKPPRARISETIT